jgi:hypothetical protein
MKLFAELIEEFMHPLRLDGILPWLPRYCCDRIAQRLLVAWQMTLDT